MSRVSRGFSLVEVLLALTLIGVALLAVAPMFVQAMRGNATGADFGSVGALAVERMELLRAEGYLDLDAGGSLTTNANVGGVDYFDTADPDFVVRWQITDNATPVNTKTITVRAVARRQVVGQPKEVNLTTVRGR